MMFNMIAFSYFTSLCENGRLGLMQNLDCRAVFQLVERRKRM